MTMKSTLTVSEVLTIKSNVGSNDLQDLINTFQNLVDKSTKNLRIRSLKIVGDSINNDIDHQNWRCSLDDLECITKYLLKKGVRGDEQRGEKIFNAFRCVIIPSFDKAKTIDQRDNVANADQIVGFTEFRVLIAYLCIYATIYDASKMIDKHDDTSNENETIGSSEWLEGYNKVIGYGLVIFEHMQNEVEAKLVFKRIIGNNHGLVSFKK